MLPGSGVFPSRRRESIEADLEIYVLKNLANPGNELTIMATLLSTILPQVTHLAVSVNVHTLSEALTDR